VRAAAQRAALNARRAALCAQLQAQRQVIAQQLGGDAASNGSYPRSTTMRLLTHQPELVISAISGLARLLRLR
jgi:hypothetical protein